MTLDMQLQVRVNPRIAAMYIRDQEYLQKGHSMWQDSTGVQSDTDPTSLVIEATAEIYLQHYLPPMRYFK